MFLNALACSNNSQKVPIWLMRQAGRYMRSYRDLRARYSFLEMCHQPELIAEVTLLPIKRFGFDAAILFSDILVIPEALGVGLHFEEGRGPVIHRPLKSSADVDRLPPFDKSKLMDQLEFVKKGIHCIKANSQIPLIGFCGAPFTVASYMIEGGSSKDLKKTKQWMFRDPKGFHQLLQLIADWSIGYLKMQVEAGVQAVQIFDSWANYLAFPQFKEFSLSYLESIVRELRPQVPVILFCKGSSVFAPELATIQPSAISLDWNADISKMRSVIPSSIALQGNLDPDVLYGSSDVIRAEVNKILDKMKGDKGFIFNLGHGIHPDIDESAVEVLVESVRLFK
jgi:uroporphyrinogen decarboxylase